MKGKLPSMNSANTGQIMLAKRIIPCLDIKDGRTVKGVNFQNLADAGDPVELASLYAKEGADELLFLDINASHEKRTTLLKLVERIAQTINIPFTVGGGVSHPEAAAALLQSGADKISLNSSSIINPSLISAISQRYGSQCVVVAIDAARLNSGWQVYRNGGRIPTEKELFSWAYECQERGAGEILFTSMDHDGTKNGFAVDALQTLSARLSIPVIASGGAGNMEHFAELFNGSQVSAALAASIFHYGEIKIDDLKRFLRTKNIVTR
jgi:imidazole glycerol-phosphate synthase subunit HisF